MRRRRRQGHRVSKRHLDHLSTCEIRSPRRDECLRPTRALVTTGAPRGTGIEPTQRRLHGRIRPQQVRRRNAQNDRPLIAVSLKVPHAVVDRPLLRPRPEKDPAVQGTQQVRHFPSVPKRDVAGVHRDRGAACDRSDRAGTGCPARLPRGWRAVFPNRSGSLYTVQGLRSICRRQLGVNPYDLRHTFAQMWIDDGESAEVASALSGTRRARWCGRMRRSGIGRWLSGLRSCDCGSSLWLAASSFSWAVFSSCLSGDLR